MLVDFRRLLPCAERFYVFSALLPANMQAALNGRKARRRRSERVSAYVLRLPESVNAVETCSPNRLADLKPSSDPLNNGSVGAVSVGGLRGWSEGCAPVRW
jgi:hypothetical protein